MIVLRSDVVSVMSAGNKKRFFPQENLFVFGVRATTGAASAEAAESAGWAAAVSGDGGTLPDGDAAEAADSRPKAENCSYTNLMTLTLR